ncbi:MULTISPECIES: putative solute-binding protein [unclassified Alcanivorax]|jgi:TRAP-type C4-dicarboxylate transport system substrate-binding protein|uniref:putative solute-binding protein n=1 Tax=unclassified Alcanivorax TaxID=2638842 RepID=UPI000789F240|nr:MULTISPECIES: putative solute-binding protein [unclassified Alcanivorax]MEE2604393.1 putative solute-binding protein [Pseudomonadota bacterium]MEE2870611.1 putative solute-binding protein [Pseudomonadota bacterium]MEE3387901.1 putative solute-binding protein [Pseudomonadota bacterium]SEG24973.1 TRAP-type C4-dicarboxylate transport system, substrate-binding protein [Alcanivorax sp. DSM 26293]
MRSPITLFFLLGLLCSSLSAANLTQAQKQQLQTLLPGVTLNDSTLEKLEDVFYTREMPVRSRLKAISQMVGLDQMPAGSTLKRTICIWDIAGRNGPVFNAAMEQRALAVEYGINLDMVPYTNETVMVDEFKAGRCDAALMSGLRARQFNLYSGSVDAIGAVPSQKHMQTLLQVLSHPRQAGHMVQGDYVVMGIFPAGAAHIFVNDRSISSLAKAAGKRVAVLDYDETQAEMVAAIGATPVTTDIVSAPNKFNNGQIDILPAPLVAYELLELYKGMSPDGGVVDYPLTQLSMQLIGRLDKFPNEVAQLIREASFEAYPEVIKRIEQETRRVPDRWMIAIPDKDKREYEVMMQDARDALRAQEYYSADMLSLQRKIRCKFDPTRSECSITE